MIAYIEDSEEDFYFFSKFIPSVKRFVYLKDFLESKEKFDLVVADLKLPDAMGKEVLDQLKGLSVPIVIFTGLGKFHFEQTKKDIQEQGFNHVLSKEMEPKELAEYLMINFPKEAA
jgi:DNA-binding response OmpR family regulator